MSEPLTPEQRSRVVYLSLEGTDDYFRDTYPEGVASDVDRVAAAIRAAVAAEREACAALCDEWVLPAHDVGRLDGHGDEAEAIAAAIRARGEPTA